MSLALAIFNFIKIYLRYLYFALFSANFSINYFYYKLEKNLCNFI